MNKKEFVMTAVVAIIAVVLVSSVLTMYTAEAKKGSSTKLTLTLNDVGAYNGKVKFTLLNEVTGKTLIKKTVDIGAIHKQAGNHDGSVQTSTHLQE